MLISDSMNEKEKLKIALTQQIAEINHCNLVTQDSLGVTWIHNNDFSVEFRYTILLHRLIVSRVCFKSLRNGCMSACFRILAEFANELNFDTILIQSVQTYEMAQWCEKFDFIPNKYNIRIEDDLGRSVLLGDYSIKL